MIIPLALTSTGLAAILRGIAKEDKHYVSASTEGTKST